MSEERIPVVCESVEDRSITSYCPRCGYGPLDGYTCVKQLTPDEARKNLGDLIDPPAQTVEEGDVSICAKCGALLMFAMLGGHLGVRAMNRREIAAHKRNAEQWGLVQRLRQAFRRKP